MGKSRRLDLTQIRDVMRLVSDTRELRYAPLLQQQVLLEGVVKLLGAERAFSITFTNFTPGVMPEPIRFYVQPRMDSTFRSYLEQTAEGITRLDDPMIHVASRRPEAAAVSVLSQFWSESSSREFRVFGEYYRQFHMADRMACLFRRVDDPTGVTGFEVQRMDDAPGFSPRQIAMGKLLIEELHHLHSKGQLEAPTNPLDALPPRQSEVTQRILAGQTAKRIAFEMGISIHTVREHLQSVYRKFEVSGRDELMARFTPKTSNRMP